VQKYIRQCLRIQAEIAAKHFTPETFTAITGLSYPPKQLQQAVQAQMAQMAQTTPPSPPPPQVEEILSTPSQEDVMGLLKDPFALNYRVDVETNSSVDVETSEEKKNIGEFMIAFGQFMAGVAPAVERGVIPFDASKSILLAIVRRYRFGEEVEQELTKMQPPPPPPPPVEDTKAAELEKAKMEMELQKLQMEGELEAKKMQFELQKLAQEQDFARQEHGMRMREMGANALIETQTDATV